MINITINGRKINVINHSTILQACKSNGINIPHFCYHENLSVAGNCRICLVEVYKSPKPVVSCAIPVSNGIIIFNIKILFWDKRNRTYALRDQNPSPYHLAISHFEEDGVRTRGL